MKLTDWPLAERPREKLLNSGPASLSDAELVAIFLRTGLPGKTVVDLARELLNAFGGLRPLLESGRQSFCAHPGLGVAKYAQLHATQEMARRHLQATLERGITICEPDTPRQFLSSRLRHFGQEVFACMYLDAQHRLIEFREHFYGTIDGASVYPRELVKAALECNAAAVILPHTHPSGIAEPSSADKAITCRIQDALALVDVRVLDHMIVGDADVLSFAERGLI